MSRFALSQPEILIVGGGIIGLSIALELHRRGMQVTVLERETALSSASTAAAGMLAAADPHNPETLLPLAERSLGRYDDYLAYISLLSGRDVPYQTLHTVQYGSGGRSVRLAERSLDPRQLAAALRSAVNSTSIRLLESASVTDVENTPAGVLVTTAGRERLSAERIVYATGAWPLPGPAGRVPVVPRKGQMLRVRLPSGLRGLREVHRSASVYVVPRTTGPQEGSALIGATIEDAGFSLEVDGGALRELRMRAAEMLPELADERAAPLLEAWAGLRPATQDELPVIGALTMDGETSGNTAARHIVATGHFRNGILLAPATAEVVADLVQGQRPGIDLARFAPTRFAARAKHE